MNILVLGANGRTGREVLRQALDAGDSVTALVRRENSLTELAHERLVVRVGSACDREAVASCLPGHDAVLSTLGPKWPTRAASAVYPDSAAALVGAMQCSTVRRVLVTSSAMLDSHQSLLGRVLRRLVPRIVEGVRLLEREITTSSLDWTIARLGFLSNGPARDYRVGKGGAISRAAVASFLLDEVRTPHHLRAVASLSR